MKRCPECRRDYFDDTLSFCLDDGTALLDGPGALEPATAILSSEPSNAPTRPRIGTTDETALLTQKTAGDLLQKRSGTKAALLAAVAIIVVLALGYGAYRTHLQLTPTASVRNNSAINTQRLTGDGKTRGAKISPDGRFLAYIKAERGERSLWLKQIQTNSNIEIVKPGAFDRFANIAFSPDGNFVYFNAEPQFADMPSVYRVPTLGGTPIKVLTNALQVQFSPDGGHVSFGRYDLGANESAVFVADADGANERKIASRSGTQFFDKAPAWAPDGKTIAIPAGDDSLAPNPNGMIALISVEGGAVSELGSSRWAELDDVVWHPSGDSIIVAAKDTPLSQSQIWEISYPAGTVRRLTNNLNGHFSVSITADGKSIVTGELYSRSAVWVSPDLKPENAKPIMPASGDTWGFSWTPDDRIVYVSDQTGDAEIWIMDADGTNARTLTSDKIFKTTPVVSPDGRYIVYTTSVGMGQLVRIDINGGNPRVFDKHFGADNADISPDGKWIIHSAWVDGIQRIFRVSIDGGEPELLTDYRATEPRYSRDGTRFACFIPDEKRQIWNQLAIVSTEGGPPIKVFETPPNTNIGRGPIWTPDDLGITVVVAPGEKQNLWLQPVDGTAGKLMTDFDVPGIARRDYSRDGKRIAIVRAEGIGNAIMITDFR